MESFGDYGGGGSRSSHKHKRFFILVIRSKAIGNLTDEDLQSFYRTGTLSSAEFIFNVVDLDTDFRMRNDILAFRDGAAVYNNILKQAPAIILSFGPIADLKDLDLLKVVPVTNYSEDIKSIYEEMGLHTKEDRMRAIAFLRKVNEYFKIKLNLIFVEVDFNAMIKDLISNLENKQA